MNFGEIFFSAVLAASAALSGTALLICNEEWSRRNSVFLVSFAAGVMLSVAFINLVPASLSLTTLSWQWVFIGFLSLYILQNMILVHPCHDEECVSHLGVLSSAGLAIHSLLDGLIISIGFEAGHTLGILTTAAVLLHKMPDGITITGILLHAKMERKKIVLVSAGIAFITPLSAAVGYLFLRGLSPNTAGALIALTAGSFIYLAAADLLPETHRVRHRANGAFFFFGILIIALAKFVFE